MCTEFKDKEFPLKINEASFQKKRAAPLRSDLTFVNPIPSSDLVKALGEITRTLNARGNLSTGNRRARTCTYAIRGGVRIRSASEKKKMDLINDEPRSVPRRIICELQLHARNYGRARKHGAHTRAIGPTAREKMPFVSLFRRIDRSPEDRPAR